MMAPNRRYELSTEFRTPSNKQGFDTVLIHVPSRCPAVTGPVSALAEPLPEHGVSGSSYAPALHAGRRRPELSEV